MMPAHWILSTVIALFPTISMLSTSLLMVQIQVNNIVETISRQFSAGLILGAVVEELFPMLMPVDTIDRFISLTLGFLASLSLLTFLPNLLYYVQRQVIPTNLCMYTRSNGSTSSVMSMGKQGDEEMRLLLSHRVSTVTTAGERCEINRSTQHEYRSIDGYTNDKNFEDHKEGNEEVDEDQQHEPMIIPTHSRNVSSSETIIVSMSPRFDRVRRYVQQVAEAIDNIRRKMQRLWPSEQDCGPDFADLASCSAPYHQPPYTRAVSNGSSSDGVGMTFSVESGGSLNQLDTIVNTATTANNDTVEQIADELDEIIHHLHYSLDHCRRLLHGYGSTKLSIVPQVWTTKEGQAMIQECVSTLFKESQRLHERAQLQHLSSDSVLSMIKGVNHIDINLAALHSMIEDYTVQYGRHSRLFLSKLIPKSDVIPWDFILPVIMDSIVDGFLLGNTVCFSLKAGLILAVANSIEMGSLGLAFSTKIQKHTEIKAWKRHMIIVLPPLAMFFSSIAGIFTGFASSSHPTILSGFVAFGVVALLHLVVFGLLLEDSDEMKGNAAWYAAWTIFMGFYFVIASDFIIPQ